MLDKKVSKKILSLFFLFFAGVAKASVTCEASLGGAKPSEPSQFSKIYAGKPYTLPAVFTGDQIPRWEDYNWILQLKEAAATSKPSETEIATIQTELNGYFDQFKNKSADERFKAADLAYRFHEIGLKINKLLKIELFKKEYLSDVPSDDGLLAQGKATVAANIKRLREKYSLSGYKNTIELADKVYNYSDFGKKALELVTDQLIVTIHRPESGRFWIPVTGFQNQRITLSSRGSFDHAHRDHVESTLTYQDRDKYTNYSARYKPQYGEARPKFELDSPRLESYADSYGSDLWVVKEEVLEARGTWTPTDSFSQPQAYNQNQTNWNEMFIPWSHREFLAPYLLQRLKQDNVFTPTEIPAGFEPTLVASGYVGSYFEVQIWGPVTLNDIAAFGFKENPPDAALLKELRSRGIQIWDVRQEPAKLYTEGMIPWK